MHALSSGYSAGARNFKRETRSVRRLNSGGIFLFYFYFKLRFERRTGVAIVRERGGRGGERDIVMSDGTTDACATPPPRESARERCPFGRCRPRAGGGRGEFSVRGRKTLRVRTTATKTNRAHVPLNV